MLGCQTGLRTHAATHACLSRNKLYGILARHRMCSHAAMRTRAGYVAPSPVCSRQPPAITPDRVVLVVVTRMA